jgi:hypothetical protein
MLLAVTVFLSLPNSGAYADTLEVQVASGNDDAEENNAGNIDLGSSDLEIGAQGGGGDAQLIGMRFADIDIPRGALINSANIQFTVDEEDDEVQSLPIQIFGELGASLPFTGSVGDISSRTRTGTFVNWENIPPWLTVGEAGPDQQTPDFAPVIQTIVNQTTWEPNNALVIMLSPLENFERTAESFDGDATAAPLLTIDFDPSSTILLGDFNFDGAIDSGDFQILVENFQTGTTFEQGDFTFDGVVDLYDFAGFRQAFEAASVGGAAVPEPSTMLLTVIAGIAWTFRHRRRRES